MGSSNLGSGGDGIQTYGGVAKGAGFVAGTGLQSSAGVGIDGAANGLAGLFYGDVEVQGNFNVTGGGTKNFKIDHPLDPENKYLYHAAIESAEALNVYSGNVTTDENGEAVVLLPDWFEAINRDFRYQLTSIGTPAQGLYIIQKINKNRFKIAGGKPGMEVSWQVTGVRSDPAFRKNPFRTEEDKPQAERGTYLVPEAYDQPEERGIKWARSPEMTRQIRDLMQSKQK
jgi:hypothetical protein